MGNVISQNYSEIKIKCIMTSALALRFAMPGGLLEIIGKLSWSNIGKLLNVPLLQRRLNMMFGSGLDMSNMELMTSQYSAGNLALSI